MKIKRRIKSNIANSITISRAIIGVAILFTDFLSLEFFVLFSIGIFTDMIDGTIARITRSTSELGSKLDTIADFIFVLSCIASLLVNTKVHFSVYILVGIIFLIKIFTIERYYRINKVIYVDHSVLNKIIGFSLALIPFMLLIVNPNILLIVVCVFALAGAIIEHLKCFKSINDKHIRN